MKKGTYITLKGKGNKPCPRCGKKAYGHTSKTKSYDDEGVLKGDYKFDKPFCQACAYCEGDSL